MIPPLWNETKELVLPARRGYSPTDASLIFLVYRDFIFLFIITTIIVIMIIMIILIV